MQVQVIGKELPYDKQRHAVGVVIDMRRQHASLFMALGRVRAVESASDLPAAPSLPVAPVYERLDMQAEISTRTGKPKRQYRRRDVRAEA